MKHNSLPTPTSVIGFLLRAAYKAAASLLGARQLTLATTPPAPPSICFDLVAAIEIFPASESMDEVWCGLDLQHLQAGDLAGGLHHPAPDLHLQDHDPFWPALADCAASFLAGDTACFSVADIDLSGGGASAAGNAVDDGMDTSSFFADNDEHNHLMHHQEQQQQPVYSSSSLSSKRSLSIDSGGTSSTTFFPLDDAAAGALFSSSPSHPAADPFAAASEDEALMLRAMMAVISSASPSSSESSSPALSQDTSAAAPHPRPRGGNNVTVRSSSLAAVAPEGTGTASLTSAAGGGGRQQEAAGSNNSSQVYHMMSERKRREKLNDSFHTLRSLLPPCSKKDKTTVLINGASFLKTLEAQVSELEEKNAKLERYVPREGGAGATAAAAAAHRRAKVLISRSASDARQASLVVMVMVECDIVDLVLHVLECLRWMSGVSVLSVDADTYSPQALLKARANIKLHIMDGDCWNEALFHEAMTKAVHDATSSPSSSSCAARAPLVAAA
ncbi:unnamed protein product [Urochloa decumbens]|uniref:BHLH domain-containing protein n=1 Tax=Urochloa decumbens TaxID=240449 RepID=A0ABC8YSJ5_9POAL